MRIEAFVPAAALIMAPLVAEAADLVVWWEEGFYAEEDAAVEEIIAAFEHETGKQVELVFYPQQELPETIVAALATGQPPDFAFGLRITDFASGWARDDRLVDLSDPIGHFSDLFDADLLARTAWRNASTGQRAQYGLPMGRSTNHVHVWKSLLEQAGFTLEDIPKDWEAFWLFWCDRVQPAVRRATGRDDVWGVGLPMSADADDTSNQIEQFMLAYGADHVTPDGRLVIDDPEVRRRYIRAIDSYTAIYRKGCTPPSSINWNSNLDNNEQFHAQAVVMTANNTLSVVNALNMSGPRTTPRTPRRSNGRSARTASRFLSAAVLSLAWSSRKAAMSPRPRSSSASW